jgi:anti-sigma B factor antagonist
MAVPECTAFLHVLEERLSSITKPVIMDMERVSYIDSRGLGALVLLHTRSRKAGQAFLISGVVPAVLKVIKLTALDAVFSLYPTFSQAAASLPGHEESE